MGLNSSKEKYFSTQVKGTQEKGIVGGKIMRTEKRNYKNDEDSSFQPKQLKRSK